MHNSVNILKAIELYKLHERILCYMMHTSINLFCFFLRNNKGIFCVPFTQFLPMELVCKTMVWDYWPQDVEIDITPSVI